MQLFLVYDGKKVKTQEQRKNEKSQMYALIRKKDREKSSVIIGVEEIPSGFVMFAIGCGAVGKWRRLLRLDWTPLLLKDSQTSCH